MIQRIRDYLHERRIRALSKRWTAAMEARDYADARRISGELDALRMKRSPEQILRMEQRMGLHPERVVKRFAMRLFFARLLPAPIVTLVFRILGLKSS